MFVLTMSYQIGQDVFGTGSGFDSCGTIVHVVVKKREEGKQNYSMLTW